MTNIDKLEDRRLDALRLLADARPDELDPERLGGLPRQNNDLAVILAEAPTCRPHAPTPPLARGWKVVGTAIALGVITASAVVAVEHSEPAKSPPLRQSRPQPSPATVTDARVLLLSAADQAAAAPSAGKYWRTDTRSETVEIAEAAGSLFAVTRTSSAQWSVGVDSQAHSLLVTGLDSMTRPRTDADAAVWRSAGAPASVKSAEPLGGGDAWRSITMGVRQPTVMRTNIGDKIYALGARNLTYAELRGLSSDKDTLLRLLKGLHPGAESERHRSASLLRATADLVAMPVTSKVRAAAYRLMADLPGVQVRTGARDPLGRPGVSVMSPLVSQTFLGGVRQRLVVDPASGELLADQTLLVEPSVKAQRVGLKKGMTVNYSVTERMSWSAERAEGTLRGASKGSPDAGASPPRWH
ncbi:CU044_5270 family protein [Streptomyces sp. NPDC048171]|uniref:CU044_5270 family protein n=1 Tax=Streptomyces sp. NPDC048171 TaxID=3365504 RepID=UPI00371518ED